MPAHQGSKAQRVQWQGKHQKMISVGASDSNDREYMVHDPRDWTKPLQQMQLDSNTQVVFTHYDATNNLFFVTNKGSTFTQFFYFSESGEKTSKPELVPLGQYNAKDGTQYFYFLPKHCVDPLNKEILRGLRYTGKAAEFITFRVPRKEAHFSEDLFPPYRSQTAAMTFDEWSKGDTKGPILEPWDTEKLQAGIMERMAKAITFNKKPGAGAINPEEPKQTGNNQTTNKQDVKSVENTEELRKLKEEL